MPKIQLDNLVKRYGDFEVLHGINLEMEENEFTVFVGPSGCGKSTTLRMIAGLETVSGGEIYIDGKPVSGLEPKARDLAMVFQDYALYPHMDVAQNMSFALRLQKAPKSEINAKVKDVAKMLGLTDFLHRKPGELSGGQRQRVALARTLMEDKPIILLDEPFSALDAQTRAAMQDLAVELLSGRTVMVVTHDPGEAARLGHAIHVMTPAGLTAVTPPTAEVPRAVEALDTLMCQSELLKRLMGQAA